MALYNKKATYCEGVSTIIKNTSSGYFETWIFDPCFQEIQTSNGVFPASITGEKIGWKFMYRHHKIKNRKNCNFPWFELL